MKRLNWLVVVFVVLFVGYASAENFDVPEEIIRINKAKIDTIAIMPEEGWAVIQIDIGHEVNGNFVPTKRTRLEFKNREDNPDTPEDETDTSYTNLLSAVTIDKSALVLMIKDKLQLD